METLEQFCGPPVSRNITPHLLCIVERLSRFNDLCGCSITLLFLARVLLLLPNLFLHFGLVLWPWVLTLRRVLKGSGDGCGCLETFPSLLTTPSLTNHGPSRDRILRPG